MEFILDTDYIKKILGYFEARAGEGAFLCCDDEEGESFCIAGGGRGWKRNRRQVAAKP